MLNHCVWKSIPFKRWFSQGIISLVSRTSIWILINGEQMCRIVLTYDTMQRKVLTGKDMMLVLSKKESKQPPLIFLFHYHKCINDLGNTKTFSFSIYNYCTLHDYCTLINYLNQDIEITIWSSWTTNFFVYSW